MSGTLGIPALNGLLFVGLLLGDFGGFLPVKWRSLRVPSLRHVPFGLAFYLSRIVKNSLRLAVGSVVSRVPKAIMVAVYKEAEVVSVGFQIEKLGLSVCSLSLFDHIVVAVEQLNDAR